MYSIIVLHDQSHLKNVYRDCIVVYKLLTAVPIQTGGVFTEEGSTVFEEELPIGTECVFKGAATPATGNGPAICLDPTTILYDNTSTCLTTGMYATVCVCVFKGCVSRPTCIYITSFSIHPV